MTRMQVIMAVAAWNAVVFGATYTLAKATPQKTK